MFNEQEIDKYTNQYKFSCNVFSNTIYINSAYRNWICEQRGQFYRLKHLNGEQCKHKNHMHKKMFTNLEEVFKFVNKHDTNVILDRDKSKRLKYDRLFEQIHR
jgi:hypothetical protein